MIKNPYFNCRQLWKRFLFTIFSYAILIKAEQAWAIDITNPIKARNFGELINSLATALQYIAGILAPIALVIAGFKLIIGATSGDTKGVGEAKKMFGWILVGTAIAIGASALAKAVVNFAQTL